MNKKNVSPAKRALYSSRAKGRSLSTTRALSVHVPDQQECTCHNKFKVFIYSLFPFPEEGKVDDRAKMSVAAKRSLFRVHFLPHETHD